MRGNGPFALNTADSSSPQTAAAHGAGDASGSNPGKLKFAISQRQIDDRASVLSVEGELDLASAPNLKWALADVLAEGCRQLVLDLTRVTFIDSTALGVLVGAHRNLNDGVRLAIACAHPDVLNIFELTGLDATFDIFPSFDDALAHARGGAVAGD
jgi:anti-sigma B factor antagonist